MANITKKLGVSETAFVFPSNKADYLVKFFTPKIEVDLCGHATIATFFTIGEEGFFSKDKTIILTQETKVGILPVEIEFTIDKKVKRVMMGQDKTILKDIYLDISDIADSLNVTLDKIDTTLPKQITSTGLFTLPICINSFMHSFNLTISHVFIYNCMLYSRIKY